MRLWEKNYLLTFILFLIVLYVSVCILAAAAFNNDLEREVVTAINEEGSLRYAISRIYEMERSVAAVSVFCRQYTEKGVFFRIEDDGYEIVNTMSVDIRGTGNTIWIEKNENTAYLCIDDRLFSGANEMTFLYAREITALYESQWKRIALFGGTSLMLSVLVGVLLYITMRKINKPIDHIAHELRTPLTSIQGYAQYLMTGKLTEEDRYFANHQIISEAQILKQIIDKMLAMGNLRKGVLDQKIDIDELFQTLKSSWPDVEFKNSIPFIYGDQILIKTLLENLISNGVRAGGGKASVIAEDCRIQVRNRGEVIPAEMLKRLNKNKPLAKNQIHGLGYGVGLCHEIARLHRAKLRFYSSMEEGTTVTVILKYKMTEKPFFFVG